jgi:hypothetical protein
VKVPLWWAIEAVKATNTPKAMVWVRLLYVSWRYKNRTFRLPNSWLKTEGIGRTTKYRALRELEAAGLVRVERQNGKSPTVTLIIL